MNHYHVLRALTYSAFCLMMIPSVSVAALRDRLLPNKPTATEMSELPQACQVRYSGDQASKDAWSQKLGRDNFIHLHHYCNGINFSRRAMTTLDKKEKRYYLQRAIANFDYVLEHWPANSPLRPEAEAGKLQAVNMLKLL